MSAAPHFEERRSAQVAVAALLALATLAAHGWCLSDGVVLDDHWHQKGLREHGWSFSELMRTLVIEPADWMHCWWQTQTVRWEYARPFFILCMKVVYVVLGGNSPVALHALSLALHYVAALLVWRLALALTGSGLWSAVAGLLFVVYPHAVITVAWPSAQNVVIQCALGLAALICHIRASGLDVRILARDLAAPAPPRSNRWAIGMWACWVVAIFTRENALLLPAVFLAFDVCFGGVRHALRRKWTYVAFGVVGAAFVLWRMTALGTPMPDVYVRRYAGEGIEYPLWLAAKLLHYLVASIWLAPMSIGPTGRYNPWTEAPGDCALMVALLLLLGGGYWLAARRTRGWWIWPLWIVLAVLPVVPLIATPHSGYLSGVGFAVGLGTVGAARRSWLVRGVPVFFLLATCVLTMLNRWQWDSIKAGERYAVAAVALDPPPPTGKHIFFINLPFINIYLKPHLVEELGPWMERMTVHVLTFSPDAFLFDQPTVVEPIDDRTLEVSADGAPYFSRLMGRFLLEGFAGRGPMRVGERFTTAEFDVSIVDADAEGVRKLRFEFRRPLSDPSYCIYIGTSRTPAARMRFCDEPGAATGTRPTVDAANVAAFSQAFEAGDARLGDALLRACRSSEPALRDAAQRSIVRVLGDVTTALASPAARCFDDGALEDAEIASLETWWRRFGCDETVVALHLHAHTLDHFLEDREEIPHARMWAAKVIRTDLYLSGKPFPGPRERRK